MKTLNLLTSLLADTLPTYTLTDALDPLLKMSSALELRL